MLGPFNPVTDKLCICYFMLRGSDGINWTGEQPIGAAHFAGIPDRKNFKLFIPIQFRAAYCRLYRKNAGTDAIATEKEYREMSSSFASFEFTRGSNARWKKQRSTATSRTRSLRSRVINYFDGTEFVCLFFSSFYIYIFVFPITMIRGKSYQFGDIYSYGKFRPSLERELLFANGRRR